MLGVAQTSREAFKKVKLPRNEEIVYYTLQELGVATNDAIAKALDWPVHCVTGRVNSLWKKSLVQVVDQEGVTRMGNRAKRWTITTPGDRQIRMFVEQDCEG